MALRLVIAEKPSVAQTIAAALGVKEKKDGFIEGGGYLISWCVGHLVQQMCIRDRHGQPLEVVVKNIIRTKFIAPKERPYRTDNFYSVLERQRKLEKEVSALSLIHI